MTEFVEHIENMFLHFSVLDAAAILLLAAVVYVFCYYMNKMRSNWYSKFLFITIAASFLFAVFLPTIYRAFYYDIILIVILATVAIFAPEIKRGIWKRSNKTADAPASKMCKITAYTDEELKGFVQEIVKSAQDMAKTHTGALMIFSPSGEMPAQILESGVSLDAAISTPLINTIFFHNTDLHDGAMIIAYNRIVAAGCFLPLSVELSIPKTLGTRHRAAIGITETLPDVLSLVVSEETGIISAAFQGKLVRYLDTEQLADVVEAGMGLMHLGDLSIFKDEKKEEV